jgi:hypothetical protein
LRDNGIPFSYKKFNDVTYEFISNNENYGEIYLLNEDHLKINQTLETLGLKYQIVLKKNIDITAKANESKRKISYIILLIYSIIATLFLAKYCYINHRDYNNKNSYTEWNTNATIMS